MTFASIFIAQAYGIELDLGTQVNDVTRFNAY
jgi:Na+/H+-dicarboxylate symporter